MSKLNQSLDISGSKTHNSDMDLSKEPFLVGEIVSGQTGSSASLNGTAPSVIVTGLTGMTTESEYRMLKISGAANLANNGVFNIVDYVSSSSVIIANENFVTPEGNNGSISWEEYNLYTAEDDNNYHRTDRAKIKGTSYYEDVPQYTRCTDQSTLVDANLTNISGKTTDAKAIVDEVKYSSISVSAGNTFVTLTNVGQLKHADTVDLTGVPIIDGMDDGYSHSTFALIKASASPALLQVASGTYIGWIIYGVTRKGSSTSPDSVEVEFRAMPLNKDITRSVPYTWESSLPTTLDIVIGYRKSLDDLSELSIKESCFNSLLSSRSKFSFVDFLPESSTTIGSVEGRVFYDDTENTISIVTGLAGTILQTGQEIVIKAVNKKGLFIMLIQEILQKVINYF